MCQIYVALYFINTYDPQRKKVNNIIIIKLYKQPTPKVIALLINLAINKLIVN